MVEPKKPIVYASCVFCGRQRPLATIDLEKWREINAYDWAIVSVRYRNDGQHTGFSVDRKQSLTMRKAMKSKDPQIKALLEAHKSRLLEVLATYIDIKFLTKDDIEGLLE
jgi:16S rRNA C1402 N4-methylase RsmH